MRALLLAGGLGTRLRPLTDHTPKCLVELKGRPLLDYWLAMLFQAGFERVLINTHWLANKVEAHLSTSPWRDKVDLVHEETLLGTGGTILKNEGFFGNEDFFVAHADNLALFDLPAFLESHKKRPVPCIMTMLAFETDDPRSCGILECDERNIVQKFHEKVENPPGNLANAAIYQFTPALFTHLRAQNRLTIDLSTEIIPKLVGHIFCVPTAGYIRDIGSHERLERARFDLEDRDNERIRDFTGTLF
jgi:mannose-1-phosphate guanylyltransferase